MNSELLLIIMYCISFKLRKIFLLLIRNEKMQRQILEIFKSQKAFPADTNLF